MLSEGDQTVAKSYYELGMYEEALERLAALPNAERNTKAARDLTLSALVKAERYSECAELAEALLLSDFKSPVVWLMGAYSIRRCRSLEAARNFLRYGETDLVGDPMFHFNMACYECQLGDIEETKRRLFRCFEIDPEYKKLAIDEPDLVPIW